MKTLDKRALLATRRIHNAALALVAGLGLLPLAGWCTGVEHLHSTLPQLGQMPLSAAFGFLLAALSIWLWRPSNSKRRPRIAELCGAIVILIGIFPEWPMAITTSVSFILIGCALCMMETETRRKASPAECFLVIAAFFPFTALIGHIYDRHTILPPFAPPLVLANMAVHTAIGLSALCVAALTARPERGWMARFTSSRPEGVVARKLFPTAILALLILGWVSETGEKAGLYDHEDGASLLVAAGAVTFGLLIRQSMNALASLEARRQTTETSLIRSEEHLRIALNGARMGTWEWIMESNEVRWSDSIAEIFGIPQGKFDGRYETYLNLIHPDDRDALKARLNYALRNPGEPYRSEHRIVWADGSIHWLAARGDVFRDAHGNPVRMAGTTMDITERKLLERELIETSNREQRRLGQDLHDDLGQWLTGIHLEARALSMRLQARSEPDADRAEKLVRWAGEALDRTRMLVRGMAPAAIETGGLADALREIATSTEAMFHVRCIFACEESLLIPNTEVALQVYRIAQEAIGNALRHSHGSELVVNLSRDGEGRACLLIRDNGRGIPLPLPTHAGMGLRIMQYRAGILGAHVDIRPIRTGGTEVSCSFPCNSENATSLSGAESKVFTELRKER